MEDDSATKTSGTLHSIDQTAALLGKSHWCVRWRIRHGLIQPVRVGRRLFIESRELLRVLETQCKQEFNH